MTRVRSDGDPDLTLEFEPFPKALYSPNYLPEKLLHRQKEVDACTGIVNDGVEDGRSGAVLLYGVDGVGKTSVVRHVRKTTEADGIASVYVDCKGKGPKEVMMNVLRQTPLKDEVGLKSLVKSSISTLLSYLDLGLPELGKLLLVLDDADRETFTSFGRLISSKVESPVWLMTTVDPWTYHELKAERKTRDLLDLPVMVDVYEPSGMVDIGCARVDAAFPEGTLNRRDVEYVVDVVAEVDVCRASSLVGTLRRVYESLRAGASPGRDLLDKCAREYLDPVSLDPYNFVMNGTPSEFSVEEAIFLDNVLGCLKESGEKYMDDAGLDLVARMTLETLPDGSQDVDHFRERMVSYLGEIDILKKSKTTEGKWWLAVPVDVARTLVEVMFDAGDD